MASPVAADSMLLDAVIYLGAAVVAVPVARFLGLGAVIGYLAAGVAIGPWGLGLISDVESTLHFAEIGVVFLLFIIGLELSVKAFLIIVRPAVIATILFISPKWTTVLHYLVVLSKIHLAGEPPAATNLPTQG